MVVAGLLLVVLVGGVVAATVLREPGDDGDVRTDASAPDGGAAGEPEAVVAVTVDAVTFAVEPTEVTLRFRDAAGGELATHSTGVSGQPAPDGAGQVFVDRALLQPLPPGDLELEATLSGPDGEQTCTHDFSVLPDERLILRVALGSPLGAPDGCATIQTLDEWAAGRGNPEGESYVGLSEDEAIERASEVGARVVGRDGVDLVITMDFRPGRVNLTVFDGTVVAAMVEG